MPDIEIALVANDDSCAEELDAYVRAHADGTPYHLSAWRQAVELGYGHPGMALVARQGAEKKLVGLLPLCSVALPLGRPRWISLPFCDVGGPLAESAEIRDRLVDKARELSQAKGAKHLELRCSATGDASDDAGLEGKKVRMLLGLPGSAEALMASYPPKLRSQIRKAEKNGLEVEARADLAAVHCFYDVYSQNMRRLGSPVHSLKWFQSIAETYGAQGNLLIVLVRHQQRTVGAGLVLLCGERAAIPWASTLAEYNPLAPNMLLYWTIQAHLCGRGVSQFDFGRSTYGEGTFKFKKQWGAQPLALDWQDWSRDGAERPKENREGTAARIRPVIESAWRKMPLAVTNRLGPRLRRYITL